MTWEAEEDLKFEVSLDKLIRPYQKIILGVYSSGSIFNTEKFKKKHKKDFIAYT